MWFLKFILVGCFMLALLKPWETDVYFQEDRVDTVYSIC